jgi:hypothetical protein
MGGATLTGGGIGAFATTGSSSQAGVVALTGALGAAGIVDAGVETAGRTCTPPAELRVALLMGI